MSCQGSGLSKRQPTLIAAVWTLICRGNDMMILKKKTIMKPLLGPGSLYLIVTCVSSFVSDQRAFGSKRSITYFTFEVLLIGVCKHMSSQNICLRDIEIDKVNN